MHYVDGPGSTLLNLTHAGDRSAILRVDTSEANASTGRKSARVESKSQYNSGLFIFDVLHTPYGCGTWPALWLADPAHWPDNGEIDVIEAVNTATTGNQISLHTTKGCTMNVRRKGTGKILTKDCFNGTDGNVGCGVQGPVDTYGEALNDKGGAVCVKESHSIPTWHVP